jgi:hypothetical protein
LDERGARRPALLGRYSLAQAQVSAVNNRWLNGRP